MIKPVYRAYKRRMGLLPKLLILLGSLILALLLIGALLFGNELRTLASLKQEDAHPLYTMTYVGDYGFDDFLKVGAKTDHDIETFVTKRLLKGLPISLNVTESACSAFAAQNAEGERLFGRNFDFDYAPAMLVKTKPNDGYASISMVNLAFLGYTKEELPMPLSFGSFVSLAAPFLSFDGMNERGVAMALLAVPHAEPPQGDDRVTLNTTTAIRLVLDKAATVEEAVALLGQYNYYFSGDVECHYLISDASGKSVVVEFLDGEIKVIEADKRYQMVTNFIMYNGLNEGEGYTEFERYDEIEKTLAASDGVIEEGAAMALLSRVKIPDRTQWSLIYNQQKRTVTVCMDGNYNKVYGFNF